MHGDRARGDRTLRAFDTKGKKNKNKSPLYISNEKKKGDYKKYLDKIASSKEKKYVYEFEGKKEDDNDE